MSQPEIQTLTDLEEILSINTPSLEQPIKPNWKNSDQYQLFLKRDDLIHPQVSGNKWRKLKYQLLSIVQQKQGLSASHIVSFGGGYSNHIHALAYCCSKLDIRFTAIIRGDYSASLTPMLSDIIALGADIQFVTKKEYQKRHDTQYLKSLKHQYDDATIIPEGGSHQLALPGIRDMIAEFSQPYDVVVCPVASAGTFAGLIKSCNKTTALHGIAMLKGQSYLEEETLKLFPDAKSNANWQIHHDYHCGGYAKKTPDLVSFCQSFTHQASIPVEPVYSGKMLFGLKALVESRAFKVGSKILAIHTGGLQGAR